MCKIYDTIRLVIHMRNIYAQITNTEIIVFDGEKTKHFSLPLSSESTYKTSKNVVILANVRQLISRVAPMPAASVAEKKKSIWQTEISFSNPQKAAEQWELVKAIFPIGREMNENTHVFDSVAFAGLDGEACAFLTAMPIALAEEIAENCAALFGGKHRLKRLDTMQHVLLKQYAPQCSQSTWVIFPEGEGYCFLHIDNGLPQAVWHTSNHPEFREEELLRHLKTAPKRAVVLDNESDWLCKLLSEYDVDYELASFGIS